MPETVSYGQDNEAKPSTPSSPESALFPDQSLTSPLPIIIHATNGNPKVQRNGKWVTAKTTQRTKLSTVVQPNDLEAFFVRYAEVCKAGMGALKKRDRSKKKRKEKKKKGTEGGKG
jgi:signal recognition particle subunit SRP14